MERAAEEPWGAVGRLSSALLGSSQRGSVGENLLQEALNELGPGMVERDFRVGSRVVDFALVLPDGRRIPVDSKWPSMQALEDLQRMADSPERDRLSKSVEKEVARRASEVSKYIDSVATAPMAVACIPDSAYATCRKAHSQAFSRGVILVPYSTAVPVLLTMYTLASRFGGSESDMRAALGDVDRLLRQMEDDLNNRFHHAAVMVSNAANDWAGLLGRAQRATAFGLGATSPRTVNEESGEESGAVKNG